MQNILMCAEDYEINTAHISVVRKPEVKNRLGEIGVGGRKILTSILKKNSRRLWTEFIWLWVWRRGRLL
jgi:hypothetical protein